MFALQDLTPQLLVKKKSFWIYFEETVARLMYFYVFIDFISVQNNIIANNFL